MKEIKVAIIADGPWSETFFQDNADLIIALDGAGKYFTEKPNMLSYLTGDMDSISSENIESLQSKGVKIVKDFDQETTDLDKGIKLADDLGATEVSIYNAQGGIIDHSLYNIKTLKFHHKAKRPLKMITATETIIYVKDSKLEFKGKIGEGFAVFGMPEAIANSTGLKYELKEYKLKFGLSESTSNSFAKENVMLEIKGEAIVIYPRGTNYLMTKY